MSQVNKLVYQLGLTLLLFFALFFTLRSVDWMRALDVEEKADSLESKLGDALWELLHQTEIEVMDEQVCASIDSLMARICNRNDIDRSHIKLHIIRKDEVNAFVLPNQYLVIYTGLIEDAKNESELMGVIGHELAHIEKAHVMKKLVKEIGFAMLVSVTSGSGGETAAEILKILSSSAYDREYETEADECSVDYLIEAGVNPAPLADFLYRMSYAMPDLPEQFYWLSTHPESKERAEHIVAYIGDRSFESDTVLAPEIWEEMKSALTEYQ